MADDADKDSKTEDPTSKRMSESRDKGQVVTSREVATALLMLSAVVLFYFNGVDLWNSLMAKMHFFLSGQIRDDMTIPGLTLLLKEVILSVMKDLAPFFATFMVVAAASSILQHGFLISFEPISPKFSKLNPIQGIKRLFSMRSLVELFKSILKMSVVGYAVYLALEDSFGEVVALMSTGIPKMVDQLGSDTIEVMWRVSLAFLVIAAIDFIYQQYEHVKGLRMTKQEVKDEMKQMEGDPLLKGRIRQIQREMAQQRMMQEVPEADVVITNPTHFSVALRYSPGKMAAPMVVAKGRGPLASRIKELAREHKVPLVENPPLARTLYQDVELNQFIPPDLFKAVAEVLAYVFGLRGHRAT